MSLPCKLILFICVEYVHITPNKVTKLQLIKWLQCICQTIQLGLFGAFGQLPVYLNSILTLDFTLVSFPLVSGLSFDPALY